MNQDRTFDSRFAELGPVTLPPFSEVKVMMLPIILGDVNSIPDSLGHWRGAIGQLFELSAVKSGVAYITIHEKEVKAGTTHRRQGLHVDGVYRGEVRAGWAGPAIWAAPPRRESTPPSKPLPNKDRKKKKSGDKPKNVLDFANLGGMLTVSNPAGCRAWDQEGIVGFPGNEGECDHLLLQLKPENEMLFRPSVAYWCHALCVHESMPSLVDCHRQFVRLSMPSDAPWFEGYTENPKGVKPTGPILSRRVFMDSVPS